MYQKLFKKWKTSLGFAGFTILTVIVLFSGDDSIVSRLRNSFGEHPEVSANESVATESVHPADIPVVMDQPQADDEEQGFVDDEELVEDGEGADPTPPEENIDDSGDENASAENNGYNGEQVIVVNPGASGAPQG